MSNVEFRVGHGIDVHQFCKGRKLIIGGVAIAHERGLAGHSDADVLVHALIDALLGAAGKGDIGALFPSEDLKWKDADSTELLKQTWELLRGEGWTLVNVDGSVLLERPKLAPIIAKIKERLAAAMNEDQSRFGVKAGTFEKMGFVGREEGIMASCVVLLSRSR